MQAIAIPGSPEPVPTDQTEPAGVYRIESQNADPIPSALQVSPISIGMGVNLAGRSSRCPSCLCHAPIPGPTRLADPN